MDNRRIYIVAKTYPVIWRKYTELVYTAGVFEDGSWVRLYPVPFRNIEDEKQFRKYSWIDVSVERRMEDFRPETYKPDLSTLRAEENKLSPRPSLREQDWEERKSIIFKNKEIFTNKQRLIKLAKDPKGPISLAIFKPSRILDFRIKKGEKTWDPAVLKYLEQQAQQLNFFTSPEQLRQEYENLAQKIPYKFSYVFEDDAGQKSTLMIEDWEIGQLYLNCLKSSRNEQEALEKVKSKYLDWMTKRDMYLILGTTLKFQWVAPNPFIVIGVFYPPFLPAHKQISLFDCEC